MIIGDVPRRLAWNRLSWISWTSRTSTARVFVTLAMIAPVGFRRKRRRQPDRETGAAHARVSEKFCRVTMYLTQTGLGVNNYLCHLMAVSGSSHSGCTYRSCIND